MLFMANTTDDMSRVEFSVRLLLIAFISMVFALIMRWHMRRSPGTSKILHYEEGKTTQGILKCLGTAMWVDAEGVYRLRRYLNTDSSITNEKERNQSFIL